MLVPFSAAVKKLSVLVLIVPKSLFTGNNISLFVEKNPSRANGAIWAQIGLSLIKVDNGM